MKEIVIKIDDARFKDVQRVAEVQLNRRTDTVEQIIAKGTELPKGHGRLIDADTLADEIFVVDSYSEDAVIKQIKNAPTIIEADKEGIVDEKLL